MNVQALQKMCAGKLVRTRNAIRRESILDEIPVQDRAATRDGLKQVTAQRQKYDRVAARRRSVSSIRFANSHFLLNASIQLYTRRERTARENLERDPQVWKGVQTLLTALGPAGMSGDETDHQTPYSKPRRRPKKTLRVISPWINKDISDLLQCVDSYEHAVSNECIIAPRGNQPLERLDYSVLATKSTPVQKLPRNWYANDWYCGLSAAGKVGLQAAKDVPIPRLVCQRFADLQRLLIKSLSGKTFDSPITIVYR